MADPFIGEIRMVGFDFAPKDWAKCDGAIMKIMENTALYAVIGTNFGGDGQVTFALPDMRGRSPRSQGQGPGLSNYVIGQKVGVETNTFNHASYLPSHTHLARLDTVMSKTPVNTSDATSAEPVNNQSVLGAGNYKISGNDEPFNMYNSETPDCCLERQPVTGSVTIENTGSGASVSNITPYLTVNFAIALQGMFPSRN